MKRLKWGLSVLGACCLIGVLGVFAFIQFVNPNDYKPQIEKQFYHKTHLHLRLPSPLHWTFFPKIGLKTNAVAIAKSPQAQPFVAMDAVDIGVSPWSLIVGRVSSADILAKSVQYDHLHFQDIAIKAQNLTVNKAFPIHIVTRANLGLPQPLKVDLHANVQFDTGTPNALALTAINAKLNHSDLTGDLHVVNFKAPTMTANLQSKQFELSDFVDLKGAQLLLQQANFTVNLHALGTDKQHMPSTLNGTIVATVASSQLKGVDVGQTLADIRHTIRGATHSTGFNLNSVMQVQKLLQPQSHASAGGINPHNGKLTHIGAFTLTSEVKNGVIRNHQLDITGKHYNLAGSGYIDLNHQTLDYAINIYGKHTEIQKGQRVVVPDAYVVPFYIRGPFDDLQKGIDYPELSKQLQKVLASKAKQSALDKLSEHLGDKIPAGLKEKVGGLLDSLLGR